MQKNKKILLTTLLASLIATTNLSISDFALAQQNSQDLQNPQNPQNQVPNQNPQTSNNTGLNALNLAPPTIEAKSWLLVDLSSQQILAENLADTRLEPASLTKLMTAYITFSSIKQGSLKLDQLVNISENSWKTGGSKMFVRVNTEVKIEDLIKGMIVQSGNDACVALAEAIAGSEENFAQMMNREAQRLGMQSSQFRNATGLPDPDHFTTARDLARLTVALINDFPEFYKKYYSIKEYTYNNIKQQNRNRLLWLDESVDGVKTGFTDNAGYCLISSAVRDGRRLLSIVLGTTSSKARINESAKLLNWGYASFDYVKLAPANKVLADLRVWQGEKDSITAKISKEINIIVPKGYANKVQYNFVPITETEKLVAPIAKGKVLGNLVISIDNQKYKEIPILAEEEIAEGGWWRRIVDKILMWFN